jgi:quercetin dioxygenase-like cupin family protein
MPAPTIDADVLSFGDGAARILFSRVRTGGGPSVVEVVMPAGSMPPVHAQDEEETVFVREGRVTFFLGEETIEAGPRTRLVVPSGVPHTYRVEGPGRARWLVVSPTGSFERFVRAVGRPVGERVPAHPTRAPAVAFTVAAAQNGIEILAPAGSLPGPAGEEERPRVGAPHRRVRDGIFPERSLTPVPA